MFLEPEAGLARFNTGAGALVLGVLPPVTPNEPPKGMAEVVMIPVEPVILNAIHDAIGTRFRALPVLQANR